MAEDVVGHSVAVPRAEQPPLVEPRRRPEPRFYRWRFAIAYLALALLAGGAVGAAVLLIDRPAEEAEPAWSEWQPVGRETSYARQIAEYVSPRYRGDNGAQLAAVVSAGPPSVAGLPVAAIVIRHEAPVANGRPEFEVYGAGSTVAYTLCGGGPLCSFPDEGQSGRILLLRRQALELALYTFKYVDGVDAVTVLLPPEIGGTPEDRSDDRTPTLYFRESDLARELDKPLTRILPAERSNSEQAGAADTAAVGRLTNASFFDSVPDRLQTDEALLVLTPRNARP